MENNLNIVLASDNNYADYLLITIQSVVDNNQSFKNINFYIISNGIQKEKKDFILKTVTTVHVNIIFINFKEYSYLLKLKNQKISISAYSRLLLTILLPTSVDKVIYMDCDSLVKSDLGELFNISMGEYLVGGVLDTVTNDVKKKIKLREDDIYINSGMLLINLKKWREQDILNKFLEFIEKNDGEVYHNDQGVINGVLKQKIMVLHPKFNVLSNFYLFNVFEIKKVYGMNNYYTDNTICEAINNPVFIHFTPSFCGRPWFVNCKHPLRNDYVKYMNNFNLLLKKDNRTWKIKFLSKLYYILPKKLFMKIYKNI